MAFAHRHQVWMLKFFRASAISNFVEHDFDDFGVRAGDPGDAAVVELDERIQHGYHD